MVADIEAAEVVSWETTATEHVAKFQKTASPALARHAPVEKRKLLSSWFSPKTKQLFEVKDSLARLAKNIGAQTKKVISYKTTDDSYFIYININGSI